MSEYQYYEFRAIDRPLTRDEMDELRALSTRAEITPTSFTNEYSFGSFKGRPAEMMGRYFDAFVYVANWGTHRLMFRIPRRLLDVVAAGAYCDGEVLSLRAGDEHVVLAFSSEAEPEGWVEGEPWMAALIPLRAELMRGDYRALYLGWLASLGSEGGYGGDDWDEDEPGSAGDAGGAEGRAGGDRLEPPVPPGLGALSAPLRALAEFLRVDDALIEVAAATSAGAPPAEPSPAELARWVRRLPAAEKESYLLRFLAGGEEVPLRAELSRRFREATAPSGALRAPDAGRRTASQLLAARDALAETRRRRAAEREAGERARREREQAEARARYLDDLARREAATWREVDALIATRRPKDYDRAVSLLVDLRDLAARSGRPEAAQARLRDLRRSHANKPSLLRRFDENRLGG